MIGQSEKILKIERLFTEMKKEFPDNSVALTIHHIDMEHLPKHWKVTKNTPQEGRAYTTAVRNENSFDITLFD